MELLVLTAGCLSFTFWWLGQLQGRLWLQVAISPFWRRTELWGWLASTSLSLHVWPPVCSQVAWAVLQRAILVGLVLQAAWALRRWPRRITAGSLLLLSAAAALGSTAQLAEALVLHNNPDIEFSRCIQSIEDVSIDLEAYSSDHEGRYPLRLIRPAVCPTSQATYLYVSNGEDYTLRCAGDAHGESHFGRPQYTSREGLR